jgi:hypothetical protein
MDKYVFYILVGFMIDKISLIRFIVGFFVGMSIKTSTPLTLLFKNYS